MAEAVSAASPAASASPAAGAAAPNAAQSAQFQGAADQAKSAGQPAASAAQPGPAGAAQPSPAANAATPAAPAESAQPQTATQTVADAKSVIAANGEPAADATSQTETSPRTGGVKAPPEEAPTLSPELQTRLDQTVSQLQSQMTQTWDKLPEETRQALVAQAWTSGSTDPKLGDLVRSGSLGDFDKVTLDGAKVAVSPRGAKRTGAELDLGAAKNAMSGVESLEKTLEKYGQKVSAGIRGGTKDAVIYKPEEKTSAAVAAPSKFSPRGSASKVASSEPRQVMTKEEATAHVAEQRAAAEVKLEQAQARVDGQNFLKDKGYTQVSERMLKTSEGAEHGLRDASQVYWDEQFGLVTPESNYVPRKGNFLEQAIDTFATVAVPLVIGSVVGPAVGGMLSAGMGTVGAAVVNGMATGTITGLASGQDFKDALKGGLLNAVTGGVTAGVTPKLAAAMNVKTDFGGKVLTDVVTNSTKAALTGGKIDQAIKGSLADALTGAAGDKVTKAVAAAGHPAVVSTFLGQGAQNIVGDLLNGGKIDIGHDLTAAASAATATVGDKVTKAVATAGHPAIVSTFLGQGAQHIVDDLLNGGKTDIGHDLAAAGASAVGGSVGDKVIALIDDGKGGGRDTLATFAGAAVGNSTVNLLMGVRGGAVGHSALNAATDTVVKGLIKRAGFKV